MSKAEAVQAKRNVFSLIKEMDFVFIGFSDVPRHSGRNSCAIQAQTDANLPAASGCLAWIDFVEAHSRHGEGTNDQGFRRFSLICAKSEQPQSSMASSSSRRRISRT